MVAPRTAQTATTEPTTIPAIAPPIKLTALSNIKLPESDDDSSMIWLFGVVGVVMHSPAEKDVPVGQVQVEASKDPPVHVGTTQVLEKPPKSLSHPVAHEAMQIQSQKLNLSYGCSI